MELGRFSLRKTATPAPPSAKKNEPLISVNGASATARVASESGASSIHQRLLDAKLRIHRRLIDEINLSAVDRMSKKELRPQIHELVAQHVSSERIILNANELDQFVDDILNEMTGLGPIEPLLKDESITDILINTHMQIYIERRGQLELSGGALQG